MISTAPSGAACAGIPSEWKDTGGEFLQAQGAGVMFHGGLYYLYGENKGGSTKPGGCGARVDVIGVSCCSSPDLVRWTDCGLVLKAVPDDESHDLHPGKILERPKVLFNRATGKFVMWAHIDSWDYSADRAVQVSREHPAERAREPGHDGLSGRRREGASDPLVGWE